MIQGFEFENAGRTFTCSVEGTRSSPLIRWWWFCVSPGDRHRYAPFLAEPSDTRAAVSARVVAYYDDLVARREAPAQPHWRRIQHAQNAAAAAESARTATGEAATAPDAIVPAQPGAPATT